MIRYRKGTSRKHTSLKFVSDTLQVVGEIVRVVSFLYITSGCHRELAQPQILPSTGCTGSVQPRVASCIYVIRYCPSPCCRSSINLTISFTYLILSMPIDKHVQEKPERNYNPESWTVSSFVRYTANSQDDLLSWFAQDLRLIQFIPSNSNNARPA
jgi:hypothetical protein